MTYLDVSSECSGVSSCEVMVCHSEVSLDRDAIETRGPSTLAEVFERHKETSYVRECLPSYATICACRLSTILEQHRAMLIVGPNRAFDKHS